MKYLGVACLFACCLLSGCAVKINGVSLGGGVPGSGVEASEARELPSFSKVDYGGSGDVHVVQGESPSVTVTLDDNLLEFVTTEVKNDTLYIRSTKNISPRSKHRYAITCPQPQGVRLSGSGSATVEAFESDTFEVRLSGSGSAKLEQVTCGTLTVSTSGSGSVRGSGQVDSVSIRASGSGGVDVRELVAREATAKTSGSGGIRVYASETFKGSASGSGSVNCYGNPATKDGSSSGSGSVRYES